MKSRDGKLPGVRDLQIVHLLIVAVDQSSSLEPRRRGVIALQSPKILQHHHRRKEMVVRMDVAEGGGKHPEAATRVEAMEMEMEVELLTRAQISHPRRGHQRSERS